MLLTSGLVPVAQEFSGALPPGWAGSEFIPVAPECPMTTTERPVGADASGGASTPGAQAVVSRAAATTVRRGRRMYMGPHRRGADDGSLVHGMPAG